MNDEVSVPVNLPLDDDGFLRRECPNCEDEFKWFSHAEGDPDAEQVDQYFCPRCGRAASRESWWTPAQIEYAQAAAAPAVDDLINDALDDVFKDLGRNRFVKVERRGRYTSDTPDPEPLHEPNDMVIVEPPCHGNEPLKVPENATARIHCLICGATFTA